MIELEPSFILHIRPFKETSAIIDFFSRNHGRVSAVANGLKRKKSKFRGIAHPFTPVLATFNDKNSLFTLNALEQNGRVVNLPGIKLLSGLYINELLIKLLPQAYSYPELFDDYALLIGSLESKDTIESVLRLFEKKLIKAIGYELPLKLEVSTGLPIEPQQYYDYLVGEGPILIKKPSNTNKYYLGQSLIDLDNDFLVCDKSLKDTKKLMRNLINYYLEGKQLNVRKMF